MDQGEKKVHFKAQCLSCGGDLSVTSEAGEVNARILIGSDTALNAVGEEFRHVNVGFACGDLLQPLFKALVYDGDELFIGKRKVSRASGLKLWILSFGDKELKFVWDESQGEAPNVQGVAPAEGGSPGAQS